jgi:hypothetical protein
VGVEEWLVKVIMAMYEGVDCLLPKGSKRHFKNFSGG